MVCKFVILCCLLAVTLARPDYGSQRAEPEPPVKYNFDWAVRDAESANDFAQTETRDGDRTEGSYSVQLPDGRIQHVKYHVEGDSGFIVDITYEEAKPQPRQNSYGQ